MRTLKSITLILLILPSIGVMAQQPMYQAAKGDTKKEACEAAEWEARKNCIKMGTSGIAAGGAECVQCEQANAYQWACAVRYVCK